MRFITSFSGGKDSMLACHKMIEENHEMVAIMSTTNEDVGSWFHNIELNILANIALNLGVDFVPAKLPQEHYTEMFEEVLIDLKQKYDISAIVFGDIDIEEHREWCENRCQKAGLQAVFPLWQLDRRAVVDDFINLGYKAMIKKVAKDKLDASYLGKDLSNQIIEEFSNLKIDECGENGEYHTLVYDGPLFKDRVHLIIENQEETEFSFMLNVKLKQ